MSKENNLRLGLIESVEAFEDDVDELVQDDLDETVQKDVDDSVVDRAFGAYEAKLDRVGERVEGGKPVRFPCDWGLEGEGKGGRWTEEGEGVPMNQSGRGEQSWARNHFVWRRGSPLRRRRSLEPVLRDPHSVSGEKNRCSLFCFIWPGKFGAR